MPATVLESFDLHGRVALVSGGSQGMGRAMALAFAEAGADLLLPSHANVAGVQGTADLAEGDGPSRRGGARRHDRRGPDPRGVRDAGQGVRPHRHPRRRGRTGLPVFRRGYPAGQVPAGRVRPHDGALLLLPGGGAPDAEAGQGQHHQHRLAGKRDGARAGQLRLQRRHGRRSADDAGAEHGVGEPRGARQRDPARGRSPIPGWRPTGRPTRPSSRRCCAASPSAVSACPTTSRAWPCCWHPTPPPGSRAR